MATTEQIELLTVQQTAKYFSVHPDAIRSWIRRGELGAIRLPGRAVPHPVDRGRPPRPALGSGREVSGSPGIAHLMDRSATDDWRGKLPGRMQTWGRASRREEGGSCMK